MNITISLFLNFCLGLCVVSVYAGAKTEEPFKSAYQQVLGKQKLLKRSEAGRQELDLLSNSVSPCEAKNIFNKGITDSYSHFISNSSVIREYLIKTHRRIYKGDILPDMNTIGEKKIIVVDKNIKMILRDTTGKKNKNAESSAHTLQVKYINTPTQHPYNLTRISFSAVEVNRNVSRVDIKVEQLLAFLTLKLDTKGNIVDCVKLDASQPFQITQASKIVSNFPAKELALIRENTSTFWKILGVSGETMKVLNENHPAYQVFGIELDAQLSKFENRIQTDRWDNINGVCTKRKSKDPCAVFVNEDETVGSVHPEAFITVFEHLDIEGKKAIANLVRKEIDKITTNNKKQLKAIAIMKNLVQLEGVNAHVNLVNSSVRVQSVERWKGRKLTSLKVLNLMMDDLYNTDPFGKYEHVKLSGSKVTICLAKSRAESAIHNSRAKRDLTLGDSTEENLNSGNKVLSIFGILRSLYSLLSDDGTNRGNTVYTAVSTLISGLDELRDLLDRRNKITKSHSDTTEKVLGVLGATVDIGYNIYLICESVKKLQNTSDDFDRNDVIADIVSQSTDLALGVVSIVGTFTPPNIGLVISTTVKSIKLAKDFAVATYKAYNAVARINALTPLTWWEKAKEFIRQFAHYFYGTLLEENYRDLLLKEKMANSKVVAEKSDFLKNNEEFGAIVFPSTTSYADGSCTLSYKHCKGTFIGCLGWSGKNIVSRSCNYLEFCTGSTTICTNYDTLDFKFDPRAYDSYKCECDIAESTYPRDDSYIDFRRKQSIFLDISAPDTVNDAEFLCRPGRTKYVEKLTQEDDIKGYLCKNAIGLRQPNYRRRENQTTLFDLKGGDDDIECDKSDLTPNQFRLEDGFYSIYGGGGENDFVVTGDCHAKRSGALRGGPGLHDAIALDNSYCKGESVSIIFYTNYGKMKAWNSDGFYIFDIEIILGRVKEADIVEFRTPKPDLYTKTIKLNGGKSDLAKQRDFIKICTPSTNAACGLNADIYLFNFTDLNSCANVGNYNIDVIKDYSAIDIFLCINPNVSYNISLNTSSSEIRMQRYECNLSGRIVKLNLETSKGGTLKLTLSYKNTTSGPFILLKENSGDHSILWLDIELCDVVLNHRLQDTDLKSRIRKGSHNFANVFEIKTSGWSVIGGSFADDFILHDSNIGDLDGGDGDDNIIIHRDLSNTLEDSKSFEIDLDADSTLKNIENVIDGCPLSPFTLKVGCTSKFVNLMGGSIGIPDYVNIPHFGTCSHRNLQITAKGNSRLKFENQDVLKMNLENRTTIFFESSTLREETYPSRLEIDLSNVPSQSMATVFVILNVTSTQWMWKSTDISTNEEILTIKFDDQANETVKIIVKAPTTAGHISYPTIKIMTDYSSDQVPLLIDNQKPYKFRALHQLAKQTSSLESITENVHGFPYFSNIFRLLNGSYFFFGGNFGDIFNIVISQNCLVSIDGGEIQDHNDTTEEGYNLAIFEENRSQSKESTSYLIINLRDKSIGFQNFVQGTIRRIQKVIGRESQPDIIETSCDTRTVIGRGGRNTTMLDSVLITACNNISRQTTVDVGPFTEVNNTDEKGQFTYNVASIETTILRLVQTENSQNSILYAFPISDVINSMRFEESDTLLNFTLEQKGRTINSHVFKLFGLTDSGYYSFPKIQFQEPNTSILATLTVKSDGIFNVSFYISAGIWNRKSNNKFDGSALEINRFVLNIDETQKDGGVIRGSSKAYDNQFLIYTLDSRLAEIDGGSCKVDYKLEKPCRRSLHLFEEFGKGKNIHGRFGINGGAITTQDGVELISRIVNINEVYGRKGNIFNGSIYVSSCNVSMIEEFNDVTLSQSKCSFDLTLRVDLNTTIVFENTSESDFGWNVNDTFTYQFVSPRSFDLIGDETAWLGSTHNFNIPVSLDEIEAIRFSVQNERLYIKTEGKEIEYSFGMLSLSVFQEEFYAQPVVITKDKFVVRISPRGYIALIRGNASTLSYLDELESKSVEVLQRIAIKLGVRLIVDTSQAFYHVWHDRAKVKDHAAIENAANKRSHLVGSGRPFNEDDTIYFIRELQNDVYIYTGLFAKESCSKGDNNSMFQTLDMTDIVVPTRMTLGEKYVPVVTQKGSDLVITMDVHRDKYPGKIIIVSGTSECVYKRFQILLHQAMMYLTPEQKPGSWKIKPKDIKVPNGYVYNIGAQDLEDNHHIMVDETRSVQSGRVTRETRDNLNFEPAQNLNDLYLTNVAGASDYLFLDKEITTILINDFFLNKTAEANQRDTLLSFPYKIQNVTVSLPGLNALLNDSKISLMNGKSAVILQKDEIPKWNDLVAQIRSNLQRNLLAESNGTSTGLEKKPEAPPSSTPQPGKPSPAPAKPGPGKPAPAPPKPPPKIPAPPPPRPPPKIPAPPPPRPPPKMPAPPPPKPTYTCGFFSCPAPGQTYTCGFFTCRK